MDSVCIVGASLAGVRAAEELRAHGFDGRVTVVGDEPATPYDRPPLSKQVLAGEWEPERIALTVADGSLDDLDLDWRSGTAATGLDLAANAVLLAGGERVEFDGLVIATGASPKRLPGTDHLDGIHTLRTLDDCLAIRAAIDAGAQRITVVGFGFIGAEVAATCRGRGLDVTLVEALAVPLERALGPEMGMVCDALHRDQGVDVRLGVGVMGMDPGSGDRVERVRLSDGTDIATDLVVVGIGVSPNTDWLEGSGLSIDNGVVCDATCLAAPGVVAAGDVARWHNLRFGEDMRIEHWENAIEMGAYAARRLLAGEGAMAPYSPIPWFWSDQYDRKIQRAGVASATDDVEVVAGSVDDRRFAALYGRRGRLVGVLGFSWPSQVVRYRALIEAGAQFDQVVAEARASS
jgi:3-phenylpropionate/trans-cinnamate dioxygenase ferredoxin reductase subunit